MPCCGCCNTAKRSATLRAFVQRARAIAKITKSRWDISKRKKILIVEDINDSGATLQWIKNDWEAGCFPDERSAWNAVWNHNVKFATLINNESSSFKEVDYYAEEINRVETPDLWLDFPWESWWMD